MSPLDLPMRMNYILDGKTPVECPEIIEWVKWFEKAERHVAQTEAGEVKVSTVFVGLDHSFCGGPPLLFETMIFGGEHNEEMWRYSTWDDAEQGHESACKVAGI